MSKPITPVMLSKRDDVIDLENLPYDWESQTRAIRDANGNLITNSATGWDTDTKTKSGNDVFSDDEDS